MAKDLPARGIISYAQNFEDVMLWRALGHIENGFYIDIGAYDPLVDSVSLAFHQRGWQGIHIEPAPHYADLLRQQRPGDTVLQAAVGHAPGVLPFFEIPGSGISTADFAIAQQHRERGFDVRDLLVPCITLSSIFASCPERDIHWLKIDVEGFEQQVIAGWGDAPARPWVIVVESTIPLTPIDASNKWEFFLLRMGYVPAYSDGLNRYYISEAHPELKPAFLNPPGVLDNFTLNGTASHTFHHVLREKFEEQLSELRTQSETSHHVLRENFEQQLSEVRVQSERQAAAAQLSVQECSKQLREAQGRAEQEKASLISLHAEEERELQRQHIEIIKAITDRHGRDVAAKQDTQSRLIQTCAEREARLHAQVQSAHRVVRQLTRLLRETRSAKSRLPAPVHSLHSWLDGSLAGRAMHRAAAVLPRPSLTLRNGHDHPPVLTATPVSQVSASPIDALLARSDRDFVYSAYYQVLGRAPDPDGFEHYLGRVRAGMAKMEIVAHLRQSPEGKARTPTIAGLDEAIEQYQKGRWPLVAGVIRRLKPAGLLDAPRNGEAKAGAAGTSASAARQVARSSGPPISRPRVPLPSRARTIYYYVDHTILCPLNTGVQQVTRRLGWALLEAGADVRFVKWSPERQRFVLPNQEELAYLAHWNETPVSDLTRVELIKAQYPARDAGPVSIDDAGGNETSWLIVPEIPHTTFHGYPVTLDLITGAKRLGMKTAFIFYDAIPLLRKEHGEMALKHEAYMHQLVLADLITPISRWSAQDLVSFMHVHTGASLAPLTRVVPLHLPGESPYVAAPDPQQAEAPGTRNLILCVGSIVQHKNQVPLVHAFDRYCKANPATDWELALAGNLHPDAAHDITRAVERNPRIKYLAHISDIQLRDLYRACRFTAFPSVEEGFGLPILESLGHGKPCLCANFGAMAEVAEGGGCYTVDTRKEDELLRGLAHLIETPTALTKLSQQALQRHMSTWHDYAGKLLSGLDEVDDDFKLLGVVYYWVDRVCACPSNTGAQRVARSLARALLELGVKLVPVKWDAMARCFCTPTERERENLARWHGPEPSSWNEWVDPARATSRDWILIPETMTGSDRTRFAHVKEYASSHGLRLACIYQGISPWIMRDPTPSESAQEYEQHIADINHCDLILPVSPTTRNELISALSALPARTPNLEPRIQAAVMPGELCGTERVWQPKDASSKAVTILCVGTIEPSANHLGLLRAFTEMITQTRRRVELVIAGTGPFPGLAAEVRRYVDAVSGIRWEPRLSDARLAELYASCDFTVYASSDASFASPILESLWHGRPCVCGRSADIANVAASGGCLTTDTADPHTFARAMLRMVEDDVLRSRLAREAVTRPIKLWRDYAREIAMRMATERYIPIEQSLPEPKSHEAFYERFINVSPRPVLSICVTTYNRAEWLSVTLCNLARLIPLSRTKIEIVVCDNASTDHTQDVVKPYLDRPDFHYYRNPQNVGMLGSFRATAHHAQGQYIWVLGDDDLIKPGAIEKVLGVIEAHPGIGLVYLNYAYTRDDDARNVTDLDRFLDDSTPITEPGPDVCASIREISTESENFFTAIYCLVFRRDHALRAYTQNTDGRPFSTMLTCIPTTYYVLRYMMDEAGYWVGEPQVVVNLNVSWRKYAPLWVLERIPEVHDFAEQMGADPDRVDRWRNNNMDGVSHYFKEIFENDAEGNAEYFSPARLMARIKHLAKFAKHAPALRSIYERAYYTGHPAAKMPVSALFAAEDLIDREAAEPAAPAECVEAGLSAG